MPCDFTVWTPFRTGLAHFASISCVQFFSPGSWYLHFVYYRFVYSFSRSFQLSFFYYRQLLIWVNFHSKIIGYVDVMLTMCSAHCICFYEFKQDQLRSTRFNSITNYIFSLSYLQRCICFCLSPFLKNIQEVEQWNVDLFISLIPGALYFENSAK